MKFIVWFVITTMVLVAATTFDERTEFMIIMGYLLLTVAAVFIPRLTGQE